MNYPSSDFINLYVKDRISEEDANRQSKTVRAILERFNNQPGLILADEVGMGKTFVALAVAVSVYMNVKRPTVIMVPPNLIEKWRADFTLFRDACIGDQETRNQLYCSIAARPEELLNLLEESGERQSAIIFLKHGALSRKMGDGFIKLAIIQRAIFRRRNIDDIYLSIGKYAGELIEKKYIENRNKNIDIWRLLLDASPAKWKAILVKHQFCEPGDGEPVPKSFINELKKINSGELDNLFKHLVEKMPLRASTNTTQRLKDVRNFLNEEAVKIWKRCLVKIKLDLPLLIFDEAHHLKNSHTQLVTKLFHEPVAEEEAGMLSGQFDRMLFLTATPFQLGHHELLNVLKRFSTINWHSEYKISMTSSTYKEELEDLHKKLDMSLVFARRLDASWGNLTPRDLCINDQIYTDTMVWWNFIIANDTHMNFHVQKVISDYLTAREKLKSVEPILQKYVIRHLKPRMMLYSSKLVPRRIALPGNCILNGNRPDPLQSVGLEVTKEAMLSFLLAARLTTIQQDKRPVFAEGLASSFEAFRLTKEARIKRRQMVFIDVDDDDTGELEQVNDPVATWYLDQLDESLEHSLTSGSHHPKIKPTVDKAIDLWSKGEKVLIFCQ
ncbi:MAG: SNF2-related protein [Chitinophagaceae bacterium]